VPTSSPPLLIPAGNPGTLTGSGNNTWLLDGAAPTLVDAGVGTAPHIAAISRALGSRSLVRVLVTHGHADHASGVHALRSVWPSLEACKLTLRGESGWRALVDGEVIRAGDARLTVVSSPGHAKDHVCFWDADRRDLYAGDMVLEHTTVMIPFGRGGHLRAYLESLRTLASLNPVRIYPGHGNLIDRPLDVIHAYLAHRELRERQIVACLDDGVTAVDAIVARLYPDLAGRLRQAARETVEAHLEKLREDGRGGTAVS